MDTKFTDAGKVLATKTDIKKIGLNFAGVTEPTNPEEGQSWYKIDENMIKFYTGSAWVSAGLYAKLKRTTSETLGPFLDELIDSKNSIVDKIATTFINISVPNKYCAAFILIDYIVNTTTKIVYQTGQVRVNVSRSVGADTESIISESIEKAFVPEQQQYQLDSIFSTDMGTAKVYIHSGFSAVINASFAAPSSFPSGIAYYGKNIYTADIASKKIYKHSSGTKTTIMASFSSPSTSPWGIAFDGTYIYSSDSDSSKIYKHSGFNARILDSFSVSIEPPQGLSIKSGIIYSSNGSRIYKHDGFSADIVDSIGPVGGGSVADICFDGIYLYSTDNTSFRFYKHSGFSSIIIDSFSSSGSPFGICLFNTDEFIDSVTFSLGALSGAAGATQTLPIQVSISALSGAAAHIRYSARILSGSYDDATTGSEITLSAA